MTAEGIKSLLLEDSAATIIRVQEEMKSHSWVHFSCHAIQDASECLKSGVYLHDRWMELLKIMRQRLPNTVSEHAFLSACQTSTGDEKLSDEAVHLAAGMLATGYRGIVAIIRWCSCKVGQDTCEANFPCSSLVSTVSLNILPRGYNISWHTVCNVPLPLLHYEIDNSFFRPSPIPFRTLQFVFGPLHIDTVFSIICMD